MVRDMFGSLKPDDPDDHAITGSRRARERRFERRAARHGARFRSVHAASIRLDMAGIVSGIMAGIAKRGGSFKGMEEPGQAARLPRGA